MTFAKFKTVAGQYAIIVAFIGGIGAAATSVLSFTGTVLYYYYHVEIWNSVRDNLGIEGPGILEFQEYSCYVTEPAYLGDPVQVHCVVRRTAEGEFCVIQSAEIEFNDESAIPIPGQVLTRLQNFGTEYAPRSFQVLPDTPLRDGRIRLSVSARYLCDGVSETETFPTIIYRQEPRDV